MSPEQWPTEAAATEAVEAAARKAFEEVRRETSEATRIPLERYSDWDNAGKVVQLQWRNRVLPLVWAALGALPDPRHDAWVEGYVAADNGRDEGVNPYPS